LEVLEQEPIHERAYREISDLVQKEKYTFEELEEAAFAALPKNLESVEERLIKLRDEIREKLEEGITVADIFTIINIIRKNEKYLLIMNALAEKSCMTLTTQGELSEEEKKDIRILIALDVLEYVEEKLGPNFVWKILPSIIAADVSEKDERGFVKYSFMGDIVIQGEKQLLLLKAEGDRMVEIKNIVADR